ncbi:aminoacyl-histidine dipeptidase [Methanosarcina sp. KYL-1]|uniref:aminoacyl-histidine dipeptidase n=1 Tax=Methanosarcina sp. KYL-1 TaxID=2602068 RepID=UPI0021018C91|nr:aminoacyl-histidine dipeptidase [Methanosarcina sp. KYL-1]MCQ1535635.1 aminoacyl-histidine dipeptidase [Methanosarcina sp. KYL-1]
MHPKTRQILETFEEINKIPRCSKHEEKISLWLQDRARANGFEVKTDAVGNVLIKVPASSGYENSPTLVLQGHMDMVCEKKKDSNHDFSRDPVECVYEGDWLIGNGTNIGADNGIALAIGLVVAESGKAGEIGHPPLELLFTVDEETGLTGALALEPGFFDGRILLNLDSEEEGVFLVGCAGGKNSRLALPVKYEHFEYGKEGFRLFKLSVEGLKGGHSGVEIHSQRANAIGIVARSLDLVRKEVGTWGFGLVMVSGGSTHNAIPNSAEAYFVLERKWAKKVEELVSKFEKTLLSEFAENDPELRLKIEEARMDAVSGTGTVADPKAAFETSEKKAAGNVFPKTFPENRVLTAGSTEKVLNLLLALPHGVYRMSDRIPGLVETSNNLATVRTEENELKVLSSQRSSVMSRLAEITGKVEAVAKLAGAEVLHEHGYPAWEADLESELLARCREVYAATFGKEPVIETVHAGLECGVIGSKCGSRVGSDDVGDSGGEGGDSGDGGIEMISMGPTIKYPHSPDEKIYIPSIEKTWTFLENLLKSYR